MFNKEIMSALTSNPRTNKRYRVTGISEDEIPLGDFHHVPVSVTAPDPIHCNTQIVTSVLVESTVESHDANFN